MTGSAAINVALGFLRDAVTPTVLLLILLTLAATLVAAVSAAVMRARPHASFATRANLLQGGVVVLGVATLMLVMSVVSPGFESSAHVRRVVRHMVAREIVSRPNGAVPADTFRVVSSSRRSAQLMSGAAVRARNLVRTHGPMRNVAVVLVAVWLLGVVAQLIRLIRGALLLRGVRRRASTLLRTPANVSALYLCVSRAGVRIQRSEEIDIPCVVGCVRPVILVPSTSDAWTSDMWHAILTHEVAHVARGDVGMQWIAELVRAAHWYNPAVKWLVRCMGDACESASDDAVLLSGQSAPQYVETLLTFADAHWSFAVSPAARFAAAGGLERRVRAMVDSHRVRRVSTPFDRRLMLAGGVCSGFVLAVMLPSGRAQVLAASQRTPARAVARSAAVAVTRPLPSTPESISARSRASKHSNVHRAGVGASGGIDSGVSYRGDSDASVNVASVNTADINTAAINTAAINAAAINTAAISTAAINAADHGGTGMGAPLGAPPSLHSAAEPAVVNALLGLSETLDDANPVVRDAARRALRQWRSDAILSQLRLELASADQSRRQYARTALAVLESDP